MGVTSFISFSPPLKGATYRHVLLVSLLLSPIVGVQLAAAQGSIIGWGSQVIVGPESLQNGAAVGAGDSHSLGLRADGSVVAWGDNYEGQCDVPAPNTGFVAVAAGPGHSLGLKADGSIVVWGENGSGQCDVPAPNTGFVAVAAGGAQNLGLQGNLTIPVPIAEAASMGFGIRVRPHPVSGPATIAFGIPEKGRVSLDLMDVRGGRVRRLVDAEMDEGAHDVTLEPWGADKNERPIPAGVYYAVLRFNGRAQGKRIIVVP